MENSLKESDKLTMFNKESLLLLYCIFMYSLYCIRRRQWGPTPVLLPGKSHGQRSLVGCSPWGREESGTTEQLHFHFSLSCIGEGNGNPLQCSYQYFSHLMFRANSLKKTLMLGKTEGRKTGR